MKVALTMQKLVDNDYREIINIISCQEQDGLNNPYNQFKEIMAQMKKTAPVLYKYIQLLKKNPGFSNEGFTGIAVLLILLHNKGADLKTVFEKADSAFVAEEVDRFLKKREEKTYEAVQALVEDFCPIFERILSDLDKQIGIKADYGMLFMTKLLLRAEGSIT